MAGLLWTGAHDAIVGPLPGGVVQHVLDGAVNPGVRPLRPLCGGLLRVPPACGAAERRPGLQQPVLRWAAAGRGRVRAAAGGPPLEEGRAEELGDRLLCGSRGGVGRVQVGLRACLGGSVSRTCWSCCTAAGWGACHGDKAAQLGLQPAHGHLQPAPREGTASRRRCWTARQALPAPAGSCRSCATRAGPVCAAGAGPAGP